MAASTRPPWLSYYPPSRLPYFPTSFLPNSHFPLTTCNKHSETTQLPTPSINPQTFYYYPAFGTSSFKPLIQSFPLFFQIHSLLHLSTPSQLHGHYSEPNIPTLPNKSLIPRNLDFEINLSISASTSVVIRGSSFKMPAAYQRSKATSGQTGDNPRSLFQPSAQKVGSMDIFESFMPQNASNSKPAPARRYRAGWFDWTYRMR